jgi:hypothetical protein
MKIETKLFLGKNNRKSEITLSMPIWEYFKPLRADEFGTCRAGRRNQFKTNA